MPLAIGLVGVFLVSAVAGGLIARQLRADPVPAASATPPPGQAAATAGPIETASPLVNPSPTSNPATVAPETTASPAATPSAASVSSPSAAPGPGLAVTFADELSAALREGETGYLNDRLHPAVIERYGARTCRGYIDRLVVGPELRWDVLGSSGPEQWSYVTDQIETVVADAWTVSVRQVDADPERLELHVALSDGTWRWFTDCGTPRQKEI